MMSAAPALSLIVPAYNVAGHLDACLASIAAQTWTDFDCIVVDDGSTDDSGAIADGWAARDARFRVIHQDNAGLSGARNSGLAVAEGAVIGFVDGDDRLVPDALARMMATLEETGADWVACGLTSVLPDGSGFTHSARHDAPALRAGAAMTRIPLTNWSDVVAHFPSAWNKLYRRSLIAGLTFDAGTWFEDHAFFLQAAARTDHIVHLPQALYLQTRGRPGQITGADDDRVMDQFSVLDRIAGILEAGPHGGAAEALGPLASRLIGERVYALRDADRRARFLSVARDWLAARGLDFAPQDDGARALALEMAGTLPLSVVIAWDGKDDAALQATRAALAAQDNPPCHAVIIAGPGAQDTGSPHKEGHDKDQPDTAPRMGAEHRVPAGGGLAAARGTLVLPLAAGDAPAPAALREIAARMLATDADCALLGHRIRGAEAAGQSGYHPAIADRAALPHLPDADGVLPLGPDAALALEPRGAARAYSLAFLAQAGLTGAKVDPLTPGFALRAAARDGRAVALDWPVLTLGPAAPVDTGKALAPLLFGDR